MSEISSSLPQGFRFTGVACGIKSDAAARDLALIVSDVPAVAAGVFTQNRVVAAPVRWSRARVPAAAVRAVVINSGNANACTGERGDDHARRMAAAAAAVAGCSPDHVLVCSTGIIGALLPIEKIEAGIAAAQPHLAATPAALEAAARAIMTTDTVPKVALRTLSPTGGEGRVRGGDDAEVRVAAIAKGAAMIGPNMATMLAVLMTDAPLDVPAADRILRRAVDKSFHAISVEGHTSTNDTVLLLANGAAFPERRGTETRRRGDAGTGDSSPPRRVAPLRVLGEGDSAAPTRNQPACDPALEAAVTDVAVELARAIAADAEGASHLITIDVHGTRDEAEARRIARAVANSPLVKTAIAGADPNWGRIVSAAGYAGVDFDPRELVLRLNGVLVFDSGGPVPFDAARLSHELRSRRDVHVELRFARGPAATRFWTCDLTEAYVRLNAEYHT